MNDKKDRDAFEALKRAVIAEHDAKNAVLQAIEAIEGFRSGEENRLRKDGEAYAAIYRDWALKHDADYRLRYEADKAIRAAQIDLADKEGRSSLSPLEALERVNHDADRDNDAGVPLSRPAKLNER
jgi:hypothetical protein